MKVFSKIKKVITALIVSVAVFFSGQVFLPANFLHVKAADSTILYDNVSILDDLQDLDLAKYVKNENKHPEIIRFMEYCYSEKTSLDSYYNLYLYMYNPSGKQIDISNVEVNMAIWFNDDGSVRDYGNLKLQYLDSTGNNLLYKFKLPSKTLLNNQRRYHKNFGYRHYEIIGIQYKFSDSSSFNSTDYDISKIYKFSGYSAYCSDNNESSLKCVLDEAETVRLELGSTNYRFKNKNLDRSTGYYLYDELQTCYFSVPEELFTKYGDINMIEAEWYEYKTAPIYVTNDNSAYNWFLQYLDWDLPNIDTWYSNPWRVFWEEHRETYSYGTYYFFNKGLNGEVQKILNANIEGGNYYALNGTSYEDLRKLNYIFLRENIKEVSDYKISRSEMMNWIQDYKTMLPDRIFSDTELIKTIENKGYYKGLFTDSIDKDRQILLADQTQKNGKVVVSIADGEHDSITQEQEKSWWDLLWTGRDNENIPYDSIKTVESKYYYDLLNGDLTDEEFCKENYCNIEDMPAIRQAFKDSIDLGNRFILFRFAVTDYYSSPARFDKVEGYKELFDNQLYSDISGVNGYIAQETVFLDFDVISLTFKNSNEVKKVIGVVANPIDIINGIDPPDNLFVPEEDDLLKKILALVALVLIIALIGPFLSPILTIAFNLLGKLIAVLLKALALIFKFIWSILTFPFRLLKPK